MPQFESTFFVAQIFWLLVCFCILWVMMQFWVVPKLTILQNKRKHSLENQIEEAKSYQKRTELLLQENQEHLEKAKQDAAALIHNALHESQNSIEQAVRELREAHHAKIEALKKELDQNQEQVISSLTEEIPHLVQLCLGMKKKNMEIEDRPRL